MKLLVFGAESWCGPCRAQRKIIDAYIELHPEIEDRIEMLDIDQKQVYTLAEQFGVMSIPALFIVKEDRIPVAKHFGLLNTQQFEDFIKGYL